MNKIIRQKKNLGKLISWVFTSVVVQTEHGLVLGLVFQDKRGVQFWVLFLSLQSSFSPTLSQLNTGPNIQMDTILQFHPAIPH